MAGQGGAPYIEIPWEKVDELLEAGCHGTEIAGYLGIHKDTLYDRCVIEKESGFSVYSHAKKSKGEALLRKKQYDTAMEGDKSLLIWLGKCRLDQREADLKMYKDIEKNQHKFVDNLDQHMGDNATVIEPKTN